jgi:hypothetical protein
MNRHYLLILLILINVNTLKAQNNLLGDYMFYDSIRHNDCRLIIDPENNFCIIKDESILNNPVIINSDTIYHVEDFSKVIFAGKYVIQSDVLYLIDNIADIMFQILIIDDYKLKFVSNNYFKQGTLLLCYHKYYSNGNDKYDGSWENNKKSGKWIFYNLDGSKSKCVYYQNDSITNQIEYD